MGKRKIAAIAAKIIVDHKVLLADIKTTGQGVYVALCSETSKDVEPYLGAGRTALTTIATSSKPTPTKLKKTFGWTAVSLGDFVFNEEAALVEKTLHQELQHRFRYQKLWIKNGAGGGNPSSTNVSLCYGPLTGLVRSAKCNKVW